ncbi:MAG: hypothetical protein JWR87_163 [Segetibacter sp.]|jgi:hypothetical protein|nr:hypothetical protein [Segetibacter sp.]
MKVYSTNNYSIVVIVAEVFKGIEHCTIAAENTTRLTCCFFTHQNCLASIILQHNLSLS